MHLIFHHCALNEGRTKSQILTGLDRLQCTAPNSEHSVPFSGQQPYLNQLADNHKIKGTLLSRTLKVGEEKVPSEFRFVAIQNKKNSTFKLRPKAQFKKNHKKVNFCIKNILFRT